MLTIPNLISLTRIPLALVFLQTNPLLRAIALLISMISDGLDGFVARRYGMASRFGTFLDPLMDKLFVLFIAATFIQEGKLETGELMALLCRDFAVLLFGTHLFASGKLPDYQFRSIISGKATTFLQFLALLALTVNVQVPTWFYSVFIVLGLLALFELYLTSQKKISID